MLFVTDHAGRRLSLNVIRISNLRQSYDPKKIRLREYGTLVLVEFRTGENGEVRSEIPAAA
jgi:hypothetical protein